MKQDRPDDISPDKADPAQATPPVADDVNDIAPFAPGEDLTDLTALPDGADDVISDFVLEPIFGDDPAVVLEDVSDQVPPASRRIHDVSLPRNEYDVMIGSMTQQLARIIDDEYDFNVSVETVDEHVHFQKLSMFINLLLENVRRSLGKANALTRELEDKVEARTRELDLVISGSNDGVWIWNIEGESIKFSTRWYDTLGLAPGSCASLSEWIALVHPDDRDKLQVALRAHLQGLQNFFQEEYRVRHGDGSYRWMWCRGRCLRDNAGSPVMMAGTQTDIHEQRSVDRWTGLPNDEALMAHIDGLLSDNQGFGLLLIGSPRLLRFQEELSIGTLRELREAIALRIAATLPYRAFLARLPGDYFMVVLPERSDFDKAGIEMSMELFEAFSDPFALRDKALVLNLVVGAVHHVGTAPASSEALLENAWTSYRAARHANMPYNLLSAEQEKDARRSAAAKELVANALASDWFVPFFQPVVDTKTLKVCGFEVLCRLHHPDDGILPTGDFISSAQAMGAMPRINRLMVEKSLDEVADWRRDGHDYGDLFISVNIDAEDLLARDFVPWLDAGLKRRRLPGWLLTLEIREGSLVGSIGAIADKVARLRDIGVKIALDDFGTGYSSLTYLNQLDIDWIKIDRSFVAGMRGDGRKRSMVRMISMLADQIGAQVCVDGVETEDQVALLQELAVDLYQGFLFGKPMSREDTRDELRKQTGAVGAKTA